MNKGEIFVVDDEVGIRLLLSEIIGQAGFNVTLFEKSDDALNQAIAQPPDMIFLDFLIEPIRGDGFIKKLNEANHDVPIVLMSGMAEQEIKNSLGETKVFKLLEKPFAVNDIQQLLGDLSVGVN